MLVIRCNKLLSNEQFNKYVEMFNAQIKENGFLILPAEFNVVTNREGKSSKVRVVNNAAKNSVMDDIISGRGLRPLRSWAKNQPTLNRIETTAPPVIPPPTKGEGYICDPVKNVSCEKGASCQTVCFYTTNRAYAVEDKDDADSDQDHLDTR